MPRNVQERPVPDVRLSADFKGRKAGEIVTLDDATYQEALNDRAVAKLYHEPVPTVARASAKVPAKKATKPSADAE